MSELPSGWALTTIGDCRGRTSSIDPRKFPGERFDLYSVPSYTEYRPDSTLGHEIGSTKQEVREGDVLLCKIVPHIRRGWTVPAASEYRQIASGEWIVFRNHGLESEYLRRFVLSDGFHEKFMRTIAGVGGSLTRAQPAEAAKIELPVPPLPEQRRIVAKIDSLTGKSSRARDHLDHIPRLVEKYKQAILAAAFRGDLTREFSDADKPNKTEIDVWKQALCVSLKTRPWKCASEAPEVYEGAPARWLRCCIGDVVTHRSGVAFKSGDFSETGTQVVRLGNLYNGVFDLSRNPVFLNNADQYGAFFGEAGDVLVAQTGTRFKRDYGHFIVLNENHRGILVNQRIACLTPTNALNPYFLKLFSLLTTFKDHFFGHETGGVNQGNVGLAGIMDAPIALPSRIEQDAIVNRLHAAFTWIERLAGDANSARKLIDHLDQAVLAKAFRGELVPQDPADESASILLERIRTERAAAPKAKRGRKTVV
jgi:type I restriction enzyme S subunit